MCIRDSCRFDALCLRWLRALACITDSERNAPINPAIIARLGLTSIATIIPHVLTPTIVERIIPINIQLGARLILKQSRVSVGSHYSSGTKQSSSTSCIWPVINRWSRASLHSSSDIPFSVNGENKSRISTQLAPLPTFSCARISII